MFELQGTRTTHNGLGFAAAPVRLLHGSIAFALGLMRNRRFHQLAWTLSAAVPAFDMLFAALSSSPYGLHTSHIDRCFRLVVVVLCIESCNIEE